MRCKTLVLLAASLLAVSLFPFIAMAQGSGEAAVVAVEDVVQSDGSAADTAPDVITAVPTVTYPSATGIKWARGSAYTIKWSGFTGASVKIELFKGSAKKLTIRSSETNDGSFTYTVPSSATTLPSGTDYKIKITSVSSPSQTDMSNSPFAITPPVPKVTYPNAAGITWLQGTTKNITWSGFTGASVKIDLFQNGVKKRTISSLTSNDKIFAYTMPSSQAAGTGFKVKITSISTPTQTDSSDNAFAISASVRPSGIYSGTATASGVAVPISSTFNSNGTCAWQVTGTWQMSGNGQTFQFGGYSGTGTYTYDSATRRITLHITITLALNAANDPLMQVTQVKLDTISPTNLTLSTDGKKVTGSLTESIHWVYAGGAASGDGSVTIAISVSKS